MAIVKFLKLPPFYVPAKIIEWQTGLELHNLTETILPFRNSQTPITNCPKFWLRYLNDEGLDPPEPIAKFEFHPRLYYD